MRRSRCSYQPAIWYSRVSGDNLWITPQPPARLHAPGFGRGWAWQALSHLRRNHQSEAYLLAAVNARQAAPIIIATGDPVIVLGGFTGRDPILTVDSFARLVDDHQVRFGLVGDGSPGLRRVFGEDGQKPLVDWIKKTGVSSIPLDGGPRRLEAPMAAAPPKGSGRSSTICALLTMAADDHPSGL